MNEEQKKKLIEDYGITDPKPVIEKFQKIDDQIEKVVNEQLTKLKKKIDRDKSFKKSQKFLKNHLKR